MSEIYCAAGFRCLVSSRSPTTGRTSSSFTWQCNLPQLEEKHRFNRVAVNTFAASKTYYNCPASYNTFILREGADQATVTMPPGDYSLRTWKTVLGTQLTTASPHGWTYTVTSPNTALEPDTGKITITVTNNAGVQPSIQVGSNLYKLFGFNKNTTNTFAADTVTSTNVCIFQGSNALMLHSDAVQSDGDQILGIITGFTAVPFRAFIQYQAQHPKLAARRFSGLRGNAFSFSVQNDDNQVLDFNGEEVIFELYFFHDLTSHKMDESPPMLTGKPVTKEEAQKMKDQGDGVIREVPPLVLPPTPQVEI